ncbi:hypothetical protein VD0004_g3692 [Verticillium dahliae]|uniref:Pentatricopeptide repeat protein n=1 Tax=Verticillium dahliae TaxID=27337 RepID=A0A444S4V0_VERDA|nr:hypothetical protein VD0004_g3692 [Verticillium dahliae]PNH73940.1 hypothetical protein VD0001_g3580 [Verticillium dahliae]RXG48443.1 hypothetical protein VDGE_07752 [Verticillium dahliae]
MLQRKKDLLAVVGDYRIGAVEDHLELVRDPYMRRYARPDGPNLTISDKKEDSQYPSSDQTLRGDRKVAKDANTLRMSISLRLRHPGHIGLRTIYRQYSALPTPRMLYLSANLRHRLLKVLGTPKTKNSKSMLRYFSVIGDVKDCGLSLQRREWNAALALASQYARSITDAEAESGLHLWNEMEKSGGHLGNGVTFNILFDAAAKSGNFTLAERIYKEMESRGIEFNRYHHVSLIHFFGLRGDVDGIRAAYKEMVEAGEMIDTVVLNCLIASFFRAGDEDAALRVYDHMKNGGSKGATIPSPDYHANRVVAQVLIMFGKVGQQHPAMRSSFQQLASTTPDLRTYRILIRHHAIKGNLNRVVQFLDEMKRFDVPLHGAIFLLLFKAFANHGGHRQSAWTKDRLQNLFSALLQAVDNGVNNLYIDTWLAGWALKACMRCGDESLVLDTYIELKARWQLPPDREEYMEHFLHQLLNDSHTGWSKKLGHRKAPHQRGLTAM